MSDPMTDQQRTAERESRRLFDTHMWSLPGGAHRVFMPGGTEPAWLRALLDRHVTALNGPFGRVCEHLAYAAIQSRAIVAWHMGLMVCSACLTHPSLYPDRDSDDNYRCDGCGVVDRARMLRAVVIQVRPDTTFHTGICSACRAGLS